MSDTCSLDVKEIFSLAISPGQGSCRALFYHVTSEFLCTSSIWKPFDYIWHLILYSVPRTRTALRPSYGDPQLPASPYPELAESLCHHTSTIRIGKHKSMVLQAVRNARLRDCALL